MHGNHLLKAHLNSYEELSKLWASSAAKDALRRTNKRVELANSNANGAELLERLLLDDPFQSAFEQVPVEDEDETPTGTSTEPPAEPSRIPSTTSQNTQKQKQKRAQEHPSIQHSFKS